MKPVPMRAVAGKRPRSEVLGAATVVGEKSDARVVRCQSALRQPAFGRRETGDRVDARHGARVVEVLEREDQVARPRGKGIPRKGGRDLLADELRTVLRGDDLPVAKAGGGKGDAVLGRELGSVGDACGFVRASVAQRPADWKEDEFDGVPYTNVGSVSVKRVVATAAVVAVATAGMFTALVHARRTWS